MLTSRQGPGIACEECRRRKLRCDRAEPQCKTCSESGITCHFNKSRLTRGPKRGQHKSLQRRLESLERSLREQRIEASLEGAISNIAGLEVVHSEDERVDNILSHSHPSNGLETNSNCQPLSPMRPQHIVSTATTDNDQATELSLIVRNDLDQLYFDRAHSSFPMIHHAQYLSWAKSDTKSPSQSCLQYVMWALGASLSTQFQKLREPLYNSSRKILSTIEAERTSTDLPSTYSIQTWVLLCAYEILRGDLGRAWLSVDSAFRSIRIARLYDMDRTLHDEPDWTSREEKRRSFWVAYCMERFISMHNSCPTVLEEHVIATRLPAPEKNFQTSQPFLMGFLPDVLHSTCFEASSMSSFIDLVVSSTLCGRAVSHKLQAEAELQHGTNSDFWNRHMSISHAVLQKFNSMAFVFPGASDRYDSMIVFSNRVVQALDLYLQEIAESHSWLFTDFQQYIDNCSFQSIMTAQQLVQSVKKSPEANPLKAHPFSPLPLFLCAKFFQEHSRVTNFSEEHIRTLKGALATLSDVNNLAKDYIRKLDGDSM